MRRADPGASFESWRAAARALLVAQVPPEQVMWEAEPGLFGDDAAEGIAEKEASYEVHRKSAAVPAAFVELARNVACHADLAKWPLLYRLLWRIAHGGERTLLEIASDPDVALARRLEKNVRREIHKMHAFVRFRKVGEDAQGRERFVAWFEPDHWIVEAATPFFRKRFASMDWSIFTPKGCAHWDGEKLAFTPGIERDPCDDPDALEDAWRTYYRSIFNPARLKLKAMTSEMPKRYWKNLPEAGLIDELTAQSRERVGRMIETEPRPVRPEPRNAYLARLREMSSAREIDAAADVPEFTDQAGLSKCLDACRRCPLWEKATQGVPGEGPLDARIVIVGEQPGDREDLEGRPFVGPAGRLLDECLAKAGVDRSKVYLTNAVKHFKWTPRGKLRLHQKPAAGEIDACKPWLLRELERIAPEVVILLGATAARSLLGPGAKVTRDRGLVAAPDLAARVILTVHPSYLLRLPDEREKTEEREAFVRDLALAVEGAGRGEEG